MIHGHGDDIGFNNHPIRLNFSSNAHHPARLNELFDHLNSCWKNVCSYPEPLPETAEHILADALHVSAEEVCLTNGATEAIYLAAQAFAGRCSYILTPTFAEYADACRLHRHKVKYLYTPARLPEDADIAWICNPNNPTGEVIPHADMAHLVQSHPHTLFLIDQSYEDFTKERLFATREATALPNVILLHSMTKRYGIPGLRVGYLTARPELATCIRRVRMPWPVNALAMEAAIFLTRHEAAFRPDTDSLLAERARVARQLEERGLAEVWPGKTHFLLARLRMGKASALKEYLAAHHGMLIRDASNFEGLDDRYFRIAIQSRDADDCLLNAIHEWIFEE